MKARDTTPLYHGTNREGEMKNGYILVDEQRDRGLYSCIFFDTIEEV